MRFDLSKPDKPLFPEVGITKRGYLEYLDGVRPAMLPLLRDRPINLERFPDGVGGKRFLSQAAPPWSRAATRCCSSPSRR